MEAPFTFAYVRRTGYFVTDFNPPSEVEQKSTHVVLCKRKDDEQLLAPQTGNYNWKSDFR